MNDPRGSRWRKWDLHVHTPDSITSPYRSGATDPWPAFIDALEALPPDFKVLGINDYIFIDGYRKVLAAKTAGRLRNIDLLLPVIELRLDRFGGTAGHLSKVNYHIIFSDEIDPDVIEAQFIGALSKGYALSPEHDSLKKSWKALPNRASLTDLGRRIIDSIPEEKRKAFGPPLIEGFNGAAFSLETVKEALTSHYFVGKCFTAVGKTEWANIKWNEQSIADKKNLINDVDLVFIAAETPGAWQKAQMSLRESKVNARLLDCSDAHDFSDSAVKDRLGNCFTWIKADTTFEGLRQAIIEFDDRVFIGDVPDKLKRVEANRTRYVQGVEIHRIQGSVLDEAWFDASLQFSTDLVAIIGNKGSGKSALLDILGLLGSSQQGEHFSFLNRDKFRQPRDNKSRYFQASLTWVSGALVRRSLDDAVPTSDVESVTYIPQKFLETICNETSAGGGRFDAELKPVIFSHVSEADRLGHETLDELILYKAEQINGAIALLKGELTHLNEEIVDLEGRNTPEYRRSLENLLAAKREELRVHETVKPTPVRQPELDALVGDAAVAIAEALENAKQRLADHDRGIANALEDQGRQARILAAADRLLGKVENLRRQVEVSRREWQGDLDALGVSVDDVLQFQTSTVAIEQKRADIITEKVDTDRRLSSDEPEGLPNVKRSVEAEIEQLQSQLDAPQRRYQQFLREMEAWDQISRDLKGSVEKPGSIAHYEHLVAGLLDLPTLLDQAHGRRLAKAQEIYREIRKLASEYRRLYEPVQRFIDEHPIAKDRLNLKFEVSISAEPFKDSFLDLINQRVIGSFSGADEGRRMVDDLLARHRFDDEADVEGFTKDIMSHLETDHRAGGGGPARIPDQLRSGRSLQQLYGMVFGLDYLAPRYVLRLGEKELHELSPGERGSLLLIFYLLVDKDEIPLLIDQPEENLDNQTVYELLVPCIREAKKRRQIFIVTHNPNLAVVCDAEQVIYARRDKAAKERVTYAAGAIENPETNRHIVDVLEGTRPAFDTRERKYI